MITNLPVSTPAQNAILLYLVTAGAVVFFINAITWTYCLFQRDYPPIRAKNIPLMGIVLLASISFWVGFSHSIGIFGWNGVFKNCNTFRVYAEYPFGVQLFLFVLSYRLLLIHRLVVQGKPVTLLWRLLLILCVYIPLLTGYIVLSLTGQTADLVDNIGCVAKVPWSIYTFSFILIGLLTLIYLTFALRNIKKSFHEYKETRYGVVLSIGVYVAISVIYFMRLNYTFEGRITILVLVGVTLNFYFWAVLLKPVYYCLFNKDRHLARFQMELGLEDEWAATYILSRGMAPPAEGPTGRQTLQARRLTWDREKNVSNRQLID